jgi:hypothetical protein
MLRSIHCLSWCVILFLTSNLFAQASFQGLGDLSGGLFNSIALGVSAESITRLHERVDNLAVLQNASTEKILLAISQRDKD